MPTLSTSHMSLYPLVNIAYGSRVIYNKAVLIDCIGINLYWLGSTKTPMTADMSGILKVLWIIGTLLWRNIPLLRLHWGTVGEITGSNVPRVKKGVNNEVNPKLAVFTVCVFV